MLKGTRLGYTQHTSVQGLARSGVPAAEVASREPAVVELVAAVLVEVGLVVAGVLVAGAQERIGLEAVLVVEHIAGVKQAAGW